MTDADVVIHNAGWYEVGIPTSARTLMRSINLKGTENVLSLALELGIPRTVHISTVAYFGDIGVEVRDEPYRRQALYRSAFEMWSSGLDEEHRLLSTRNKRDLVSRLKTVEASE